MKHIFALILCFPLLSFAQEEMPTTQWNFEINMAAMSMRSGKSPLVGPSAVYRASEKFSLGARSVMSLNGTSYESLASFNLFQRFHLNQTKTSLFIELSQAYNQTNRKYYFPSWGLSLGLNHQLSNFFSVGGVSGFETDLEEGKTYPKVLAFIAVKM